MILKGKGRVIFYKNSAFKDKEGKDVSYTSFEFADELMNKFSATVPEYAKSKVDLQTSDEPQLVDGEIEILLTRPTSEGKSYNKLQVVSFTKSK